jgi:hypothetical protein
MLVKENNNEPSLEDNETLDQQLQRLSEISIQALEELAEMIEVTKDVSDK